MVKQLRKLIRKNLRKLVLFEIYTADMDILNTYWEIKSFLEKKQDNNNFWFDVDESNTSNSIYIDIRKNRKKFEIRISDHKSSRKVNYDFNYESFSMRKFESVVNEFLN